jgi:hypothetical protein
MEFEAPVAEVLDGNNLLTSIPGMAAGEEKNEDKSTLLSLAEVAGSWAPSGAASLWVSKEYSSVSSAS